MRTLSKEEIRRDRDRETMTRRKEARGKRETDRVSDNTEQRGDQEEIGRR